MRSLLLIACALALSSCASGHIAYPSAVSPLSGAAAEDSITVEDRRAQRDARSAQQRFEGVRWSTLGFGASRGVPFCHEVIGRFCLWYSESGTSWQPPGEPPRLAGERDRLLVQLREAADAAPRDWWVRGQLVRYLVEAERLDEALAAARECSGDLWWCIALTAYVHHARAEIVAAEHEFERALAGMPEVERRRWTDLTPLLPPSGRRAYRRMSDEARAAFEDRTWWLADPLFSRAGNSRRTEHFSRHVLERILSTSRTPGQISWGPDNAEILLRFGAPRGWERLRPAGGDPQAGRAVITHLGAHGRDFIPPAGIVSDPRGVAPGDWRVNVERSRSEYSPSYVSIFNDLSSQVAAFRRGDSVRIVAAWELPADSVSSADAVQAALVRATSEREAPRMARLTRTGARGSIVLDAPPADAVVSLELIVAGTEMAARSRHGLRTERVAGAGFGLSDVLLLEPGGAPPASLDDALPRARGALRASSSSALGIFWEVYGLTEQGESIGFELSLREDRSRRGLARALGIGRAPAAVDMRWREHVRGPLLARALELQIGDLPAGVYTMELTATRTGERRARATRRIVVTR
jgi:hypothetical protein